MTSRAHDDGVPVLPPDRRPRVVLHVGMGKTGTSTIQATCHRNRDRLLEAGILYPRSPGRRRHLRLGLAMQPDGERPRTSVDWRRQDEATPEELRPVLERELVAEVAEAAAPTLLLSDEALLVADPAGLPNLRDLLDRLAARVRVVAYLRRQDDHVCSRYQQVVKRAGEVRRLTERVEQMDLTRVYDYHARLVAWRDLVQPDELVVRTFEPDRFRHGSLLEDFVDAAGLDVRVPDLSPVPSRNESLDAEAVEFMRLFNLLHHERGEVPALQAVGQVVRRLERAPGGGPTLTLPDDALDRFMGQWEESNRAVAREFLPEAPETLFAAARKTRGTTTEQRLDPSRVDHYVGLAGLPDDVRAPLRRIAEREASR